MNLKRLTLFGYYALSYGQDNNEGQLADPYNLRAEWGPSTWGDVRHKMALAPTVKMPWGFSINPFLLASSGQPYTITTGLDPANTGFPAARPAMLGRNSARGPATSTLRLNLSRTWLFKGGVARDATMSMQNGGGHGHSESVSRGLTLSLSTLNALNRVNLAPPNGDLLSPYFGQSLGLADLLGHMTKTSTYNRRIDLQVRLTF